MKSTGFVFHPCDYKGFSIVFLSDDENEPSDKSDDTMFGDEASGEQGWYQGSLVPKSHEIFDVCFLPKRHSQGSFLLSCAGLRQICSHCHRKTQENKFYGSQILSMFVVEVVLALQLLI